jgi:hypothetical protein
MHSGGSSHTIASKMSVLTFSDSMKRQSGPRQARVARVASRLAIDPCTSSKRRCARDTNCVSDGNAAMNQMIVAAARRGVPTGAVARLSGGGPREQLDGLMAAHAEAQRAGNEDALGILDFKIDGLLDAARAGGAQSRDPQTGQFVAEPAPSFDAGVRGTRLPAPPAGMVEPESATQLLRRSLETYGAERRAANAGLSAGARQIANLSNA